MAKENEEIKEATVEVVKMSEDEKLRRLAFLREKAILDEKDIFRAGVDKGMEEGMTKGKQEGIEETKIEIAKKLKERNATIKEIMEITGLSEKEIKSIN